MTARQRYIVPACLFAIGLMLAACAGTGTFSSSPLAARAVLASPDCGYHDSTPAIQILESRVQLDQVLTQLRVANEQSAAAQARLAFDYERLVLIHMGRQRSGGYGLLLQDGAARLQDGWVLLPLQWQMPSPDMMVTQALTSPCLLVALPRHRYSGIRVLDQQGKTRVEKAL